MLNVLEKVVVGVAIFCVIVTLMTYVVMEGPPSTAAKAFVGSVSLVRDQDTPRPPPKPGETAAPAPELTQSDEEILSALRTQNPRAARRLKSVRRKTYKVPVDLFEEVSKTANWTKQLKTAKSKVARSSTGETRLEVYDIAPDSYLRNFDIRDHDIIELIDGEVVEFSEDSTATLYGIFQEKLDKLRDGDAISITVSRRGQPVHLEFKLPGE